MGLQAIQAELACYAVPVVDFDHHWGVSTAQGEVSINYFGRAVTRNDVLAANREKFLAKWYGQKQKGIGQSA
jgi:hypothetical protein